MLMHNKKKCYFLILYLLIFNLSLFANLPSLDIEAEVEFSVNPERFIFNRTSTSSFTLENFTFNTNTTEYNYSTFYPADSLKITFPSAGNYQLETTFYGSISGNQTTFIQALVNGCICVPLIEAESSTGMDGNGNPNANTNSNVLTIVSDPGEANEKIYTLRFRRRADTEPTTIVISETAYEFSALVTGVSSIINGDNIASLQETNWSVNPITGTAYFNGNQLIPLSNGDVTVTATLENDNSISAVSETYTLSGISNWSPHLSSLELIDKYDVNINLSPQFTSNPNDAGDYTCSIVDEYSTLRLKLKAPVDCQVYIDDARVSSNGCSYLKIPPTDPINGPLYINYVIKVENSQGAKSYNLNIQREVKERLKYGRTSGNPPHLASAIGDVFGFNTVQTDKFSIQAWVRWTSETSEGQPWANIASQTYSSSGSNGTFWLQHNYNNTSFEFAINPTGTRRYVLSDASKVTIQRGVWYLVTGVYDGDRSPVRIYINDDDVSDRGVYTEGQVLAPDASAAYNFNVGKMPYGGRQFPGNIRNLRIWVEKALTATEIANDFPNTPLAGSSEDDSDFSWPLNEISNGSISNGNGSLNLSMVDVQEDDFVACCTNNRASGKALVHRPEKMDLSSATSESVILFQADGYSGNNFKFNILGPLENASKSMEVWDHNSNSWKTSDVISEGIAIDSELGNPTTGTYFWIPVRLATSTDGAGRYVDDDDDDDYDGNDTDAQGRTQYNTMLPLPTVAPMNDPFTVSGTLIGNEQHPLTEKYVILGYDAVEKGRLITGTSTLTASKDGKSNGSYTLVSDVPLYRVEVRTQDDILVTDVDNAEGWDETLENGGVINLDPITLPVELSSFTVSAISNGAKLQWVTQTESNISGYHVYRALVEDFSQSELVSPVIESNNSVQTQIYSYTDSDIMLNVDYYYWLKATEFSGEFRIYGPVSIFLEENEVTPEVPIFITGIESLYPNPFNPQVNIRYSLKDKGNVRISIYNLKGQKIHRDEIISQEKGYHSYVWDGRKQTSGIYFVEFVSGKYKEVRKVTLRK